MNALVNWGVPTLWCFSAPTTGPPWARFISKIKTPYLVHRVYPEYSFKKPIKWVCVYLWFGLVNVPALNGGEGSDLCIQMWSLKINQKTEAEPQAVLLLFTSYKPGVWFQMVVTNLNEYNLCRFGARLWAQLQTSILRLKPTIFWSLNHFWLDIFWPRLIKLTKLFDQCSWSYWFWRIYKSGKAWSFFTNSLYVAKYKTNIFSAKTDRQISSTVWGFAHQLHAVTL